MPLAALVRCAAVLAVCGVVAVTMAPSTVADPNVAPVNATTPAEGQVPSAEPAILNTPDGGRLALGAKEEAFLPVAPLTTAISSREYVASGIFVASLAGAGSPQGEFEVGYEIGCGIDMSTSDGVTIGGGAGLSPGIGTTALLPGTTAGLLPIISAPINGSLTVGLKPGLIIVVPVVKKQFKSPDPWVMISNFHVKIDGCVGQSFIRSYATLTRITDQSDVVLSYIGVTKAV
jgi:MspA